MSIDDKASRLGFLDKEVNNQIITFVAWLGSPHIYTHMYIYMHMCI